MSVPPDCVQNYYPAQFFFLDTSGVVNRKKERVAAESRIEVKITWPQQARLLIAKKILSWALSPSSSGGAACRPSASFFICPRVDKAEAHWSPCSNTSIFFPSISIFFLDPIFLYLDIIYLHVTNLFEILNYLFVQHAKLFDHADSFVRNIYFLLFIQYK